MSTIFSLWTVTVFVLFIGIVVWAWSSKNKASFDEAARIPLEDDDDVEKKSHKGESEHG